MQAVCKKYLFIFAFVSFVIHVSPTPKELLSFIDTTTESKIKHSTLYLKANYFQHSGQFHQALKVYNDLFVLDAPSYVYDGYLRLLSQTNQFAAISVLIDKTQELFKDNLEIQIIYAQSLLNTNRDAQARELLEKLKQKYPGNTQINYYSAAHSEKTNNLQKALNDINTFLEKKPNQAKFFLFYFLKAKILLKMGNYDHALAAIDKSLALVPKFDKGILFKALLLEQAKKIDQAIEWYKKYLQVTKHDPAITKQLVQLLFSQKKFAQAAAQLKKLKNPNPEYYADLALLEWKAKNHQAALTSINKALSKKPFFEKAILLKIEICIALQQHNEIAPIIQKWLVKKPRNNTIIKLLLKLTNHVKIISSDQAIAILQAAQKKHKNLYTIPLALADLCLQKKQYQKAFVCYKKTSELTKNKNLQSKLSFQMGFVQFAMGNRKKATETLDRALNQQIVYPPTYNLMAFMLAQSAHNSPQNLTRALNLIDKALATNPQSPYFLDTKAIILEKQGKYCQAIKLFDLALTFAPSDKIIQNHKNHAQKNQSYKEATDICLIP